MTDISLKIQYFCPPWAKPLTKEEDFVLYHIHKRIYGSQVYILDSLGSTHCNLITYERKNRVI